MGPWDSNSDIWTHTGHSPRTTHKPLIPNLPAGCNLPFLIPAPPVTQVCTRKKVQLNCLCFSSFGTRQRLEGPSEKKPRGSERPSPPTPAPTLPPQQGFSSLPSSDTQEADRTSIKIPGAPLPSPPQQPPGLRAGAAAHAGGPLPPQCRTPNQREPDPGGQGARGRAQNSAAQIQCCALAHGARRAGARAEQGTGVPGDWELGQLRPQG